MTTSERVQGRGRPRRPTRRSPLNLLGPLQSGLDMGKDILLADVVNELGLLQELGRLTMGSA